MKNIPMQASKNLESGWPSSNVAEGGVFNVPKVEYSKETHEFISCKVWYLVLALNLLVLIFYS